MTPAQPWNDLSPAAGWDRMRRRLRIALHLLALAGLCALLLGLMALDGGQPWPM